MTFLLLCHDFYFLGDDFNFDCEYCWFVSTLYSRIHIYHIPPDQPINTPTSTWQKKPVPFQFFQQPVNINGMFNIFILCKNLLHFLKYFYYIIPFNMPIPVAVWSKARSVAACLLRSWVRIPPGTWMFVVSVVCCQVEVPATNWSLVQRSPTDCGASLCVI